MEWTPVRWRAMIYLPIRRRTTYNFQILSLQFRLLRLSFFACPMNEYICFDCERIRISIVRPDRWHVFRMIRAVLSQWISIASIRSLSHRIVWIAHGQFISDAKHTYGIDLSRSVWIDDEVTFGIERRLVFCLFRTGECWASAVRHIHSLIYSRISSTIEA